MTQGFKMRSQPLFICPALWPRYRCGEKKTAILSNVQSSVGTWRKFSSTYTGDQFQQEKLHIQCLKGRWGRWSEGGGGVIALTTKNHMHIHFCASDYEWAAGHWLTLIIVLFSLSFYEWQSSKGKKKKTVSAMGADCHTKPWGILVLCKQSHWRIQVVNVQSPSLCWQITSLWHNSDYGLKKEAVDGLSRREI